MNDGFKNTERAVGVASSASGRTKNTKFLQLAAVGAAGSLMVTMAVLGGAPAQAVTPKAMPIPYATNPISIPITIGTVLPTLGTIATIPKITIPGITIPNITIVSPTIGTIPPTLGGSGTPTTVGSGTSPATIASGTVAPVVVPTEPSTTQPPGTQAPSTQAPTTAAAAAGNIATTTKAGTKTTKKKTTKKKTTKKKTTKKR